MSVLLAALCSSLPELATEAISANCFAEKQDDDGVVMHTTRTGATLFFRKSYEGILGHDESCWEWSLNCQDWFPTFDLKKLVRTTPRQSL